MKDAVDFNDAVDFLELVLGNNETLLKVGIDFGDETLDDREVFLLQIDWHDWVGSKVEFQVGATKHWIW